MVAARPYGVARYRSAWQCHSPTELRGQSGATWYPTTPTHPMLQYQNTGVIGEGGGPLEMGMEMGRDRRRGRVGSTLPLRWTGSGAGEGGSGLTLPPALTLSDA